VNGESSTIADKFGQSGAQVDFLGHKGKGKGTYSSLWINP